MNKNEIREKLQEKNQYDEFTLNCLTEYLMAVQNSLPEYITIEEAIKRFTEDDRIKGGIKVVEQIGTTGFEASYNMEEKCIYTTSKNDDIYSKLMLFHEFTHVLSIQELGENIKIGLKDTSKGDLYNVGFNEAVTEYLTFKLMKDNYNYEVPTGYLIIVEQLINLMELVPASEIIDCYFYNCNKFDDMLRKHGVDNVELLRSIFDILRNKEKTILQIRRKEVIEENDTLMLVIKDDLYLLYTKRFLPVDSIEKFEEKIKFVSQFMKQHDSMNYVDEYGTAIDILCDKEELVEMGFDDEQLSKIIKKYGIDLDDLNQFLNFNFLDATCTDAGDPERTSKAIEMYETYGKIGKDKYVDLTSRFIIKLYDDFFLSNPDNGKDLSDNMKILVIGMFLKQHPQYDFDELEIKRINYHSGESRSSMIIIKTMDNRTHFVEYSLNNELNPTVVQIEKNKYILNYGGGIFRIEVDIGEEAVSISNLSNPQMKIEANVVYTKGSNYEYIQNRANGDANPKSKEKYTQILEMCKQRIQRRRKVKNINHTDIE
ncbi:MAG: hypothetical protein IJH12_01125 [Clostridia bacterium]|nr:hypothetical protein [Clostridia bacterium]